ncbi:NosD domain-containing protein [Actinoplanes sp. NPDC024001]|uniref:right-handed parallel beta-helix repeat-containing protein n=1 Tax=Actinoplanes sp. NPDC024001 TaxID=3154598 RepID=UPI0033EE6C85
MRLRSGKVALACAVTAVLAGACSTADEPKAGQQPKTAPTASGAPGSPLELPTGPLATGPLSTTGSTGTTTGGGTGSAGSADCAEATVQVSTAEQLTAALKDVAPGTSIRLADGVYEGTFAATGSGTESQPVSLCGSAGAILDGGGIKKGYGLHLDGTSFWRVSGFTVRNAQKGVMGDGVTHSVIRGLTVEQIGDEGIHLRKFSTDNVIEKNTVRDTGNRRTKYGEGIYIGSANSNWGEITSGAPDASDRNVVRGNKISDTTAEAVDIKEGTTGGTVDGNTFDGSALVEDDADSWVDVKGNSWTISNNTGTNSPNDGFQTHQVYSGWGIGNTFTGNVATVNGPGYGFRLTPVKDNRVTCDNKASSAAEGLSNTPCDS